METDHCVTVEAATGWTPELLCQLVEAVREYAIFATDVSGEIMSWNVGAKEIFGYTAQEAIGRNISMVFTPEDRADEIPEKERETARREGYAEDRRWHLKKDGSAFFASGIQTPLCGPDGKLTGFAKIARDLTDLTQAQKELEAANDSLEIKVRERTRELADANESLRHEVVQRKGTEKQRVNLLRKIVRTQEDERKRIAREIHDHVGQQMTALQLNLAHVIEQRREDKELVEELARVENTIREIDSDVDFLVWELRPAMLEDLGLVVAMENFVNEWAAQFSTAAEFKCVGDIKADLLPEIEINLYRIVQEALNNVCKHAKAGFVSVLLDAPDGNLSLIIEDDGVGFVPKKQPNVTDEDRGLGLVGMKERAELLGGSFEIETSPGNGTTIFVRVPAGEAGGE
jgi:PAS domain S-box-containing protein